MALHHSVKTVLSQCSDPLTAAKIFQKRIILLNFTAKAAAEQMIN